MTSPNPLKSLKVSPDTHSRVMALARELEGTAEGAVHHLLGLDGVHVRLEPIQQRRWEAAAARIGVSVSEFVRLRIESSLHFNTTAEAVYGIHAGVHMLCRQAGLKPPLAPPHDLFRAPPQ